MIDVSSGILSRGARVASNLAPIGRSLLAGLGAALVFGGVGSRIAMRFTAIMAGPEHLGEITDAGATVGVISRDGTMFLLFFGTLVSGVAGGFVYAAVRPWLPAHRAGGVFGLFALATLGSHVIEAANPDFAGFGSARANVAMFAALFVLAGITTHRLYGRLDRLHGSRVTGLLGLLAAIVLVPAIVGIVGVSTDLPGGGIPGAAALLVGVIVAALVTQVVAARRAAAPLDDVGTWMGPRLRSAGQIVGVVAAAVGAWVLAGEVAGILSAVE